MSSHFFPSLYHKGMGAGDTGIWQVEASNVAKNPTTHTAAPTKKKNYLTQNANDTKVEKP